MAINLSQLSAATTTATALSGLILVSPQSTIGYQPQNSPSWKNDTSTPPKAILFNYEGEQKSSLQSDITDHFVEDNTAVQDQIALKPVKITTQGFVGELNDIAPAALLPLRVIAEKLTIISGYAPALSTTALLAYANAFQLYQVAQSVGNSAVSTWSAINGGSGQSVINGSGIQTQPNQNQQQIYYQQFYGYWQARTLFTVQTPWAVFQDMAIENLEAVQSGDSKVISDFNITFKQMRFASTLSVQDSLYSNNNNFGGRAFNQGARTVNLGVSTAQTSTTPFSLLTGG